MTCPMGYHAMIKNSVGNWVRVMVRVSGSVRLPYNNYGFVTV